MEADVQELARKFRQMNMQHHRTLDHAVAKTGVYRGQHHMLMTIHRNRMCSQKELAQWMDISPAAVAVSLKKLEKDGYVRRIVDDADNRRHKIDLTEQGEQVVLQSYALFQAVDGKMFACCTEEERKIFSSCLDKMYESLREMERVLEEECT